MPKMTNNKWIWLLVFCVAVVIYLVLDLLDWAMMPRQILLFPICALDMLIAGLWILLSLCYFFIMFIGMIGMME